MNTEEWTRIAALSTLADITGKFGHVAWAKLVAGWLVVWKMFHDSVGNNDPSWLAVRKWVETTNQDRFEGKLQILVGWSHKFWYNSGDAMLILAEKIWSWTQSPLCVRQTDLKCHFCLEPAWQSRIFWKLETCVKNCAQSFPYRQRDTVSTCQYTVVRSGNANCQPCAKPFTMGCRPRSGESWR